VVEITVRVWSFTSARIGLPALNLLDSQQYIQPTLGDHDREKFTSLFGNSVPLCKSRRSFSMHNSQHVYEVRPRRDKRGVDLISDALPFDAFWYTKPDHAIGYAKFRSRSHNAAIRV
jgi:hypothetical protein